MLPSKNKKYYFLNVLLNVWDILNYNEVGLARRICLVCHTYFKVCFVTLEFSNSFGTVTNN